LLFSYVQARLKMRIAGFLTKHNPVWGLLALLLIPNVFVSAAVLPALSTNVKRDAPSFLNGLLSQFKSGIPVASQAGIDLFNQLLNGFSSGSYSIPQKSLSSIVRAANIAIVRGAFLYGPPLAGGPAYPSGLLGLAKDVQDTVNIQLDLTPEIANAALDLAQATLDTPKVRKR
jgi:hypothetical protein